MEQFFIACTVIASMALAVVGYKHISLQKEYVEYKVTTETKIGNLESELNKAKLTIENQNKKVDEYKAAINDSVEAISNLQKELSIEVTTKSEYIQKELKKDNSSDNQLKLLNGILYEFSKGN